MLIFSTLALCAACQLPATSEAPRHLLAADAAAGRIALLQFDSSPTPSVLWAHPISEIHDLQLLDSGHILFQDSWTHLLEVDPDDDEIVWEYDAATQNRTPGDGRLEVHSFARMPDGTTMIAESGPGRIIFVDAAGAIVSQFPLQVSRNDPHRDTRLVRVTPAGTLLVAHEGDGRVREYDRDGNVIWQYDVPLFGREPAGGHGPEAWGNAVFCAIRLDSGNTLIATGNGHRILEVTPDGEIVWSFTQDELEGIRLAWVTTLQVLDSGNIVLGNCHAGPDQPQIVEITRGKQVVWTYHDFDLFGNALSNSLVIETDDPEHGS